MKERINPIHIANNVVTVYINGKPKDIDLPDDMKVEQNVISVSKGRIYLNGFVYNEKTKKWDWTIRSFLVHWLLS